MKHGEPKRVGRPTGRRKVVRASLRPDVPAALDAYAFDRLKSRSQAAADILFWYLIGRKQLAELRKATR